MGGVAVIVDTVLGCPLGKGTVTIVDKEFVVPLITFHITGIAYIDIHPSVTVDIRNTSACGPLSLAGHPRFYGDILKDKVALVQIKHIGSHIGREEDIQQTVIVDIPQSDPSPVVEITIGIDIELLLQLFFVVEMIDKTGMRSFRRHQGK